MTFCCFLSTLYSLILSFVPVVLTTTGCSMATKQQILCLCSIRAFLRACFSVSSSRMYLSLTSCMALSNWGWISPRPCRQKGHASTHTRHLHSTALLYNKNENHIKALLSLFLYNRRSDKKIKRNNWDTNENE